MWDRYASSMPLLPTGASHRERESVSDVEAHAGKDLGVARGEGEQPLARLSKGVAARADHDGPLSARGLERQVKLSQAKSRGFQTARRGYQVKSSQVKSRGFQTAVRGYRRRQQLALLGGKLEGARELTRLYNVRYHVG
jgi:hypothetical protein